METEVVLTDVELVDEEVELIDVDEEVEEVLKDVELVEVLEVEVSEITFRKEEDGIDSKTRRVQRRH